MHALQEVRKAVHQLGQEYGVNIACRMRKEIELFPKLQGN